MYVLNNQNNWTVICINKNKVNELSKSVYIYSWEQWGFNIQSVDGYCISFKNKVIQIFFSW